MGDIDSTSKVFVQNPEVFQDIFKPMDPESLFVQRLPASGKDKRSRRRHRAKKALMLARFSRDVIKTCVCASGDEADYIVLGVENQSYADRFMPDLRKSSLHLRKCRIKLELVY